MEALAAIQRRIHRLLTWYQLTHGRSPHSQAETAIQDPIYRACAHTRPGRWKSDDGRRDDIRRAMEALGAIQGRLHRLLTWYQLTHGRSPHSQAEMAIQDPIYRARAHTKPGRWGKVMTADETTYGGPWRLWGPFNGGYTGS